jgi:hypothetical protein
VVYQDLEGEKAPAGAQGNYREFAKTYKFNTHLRRAPVKDAGGNIVRRATYAKITDVKRNAEFVMIGDGLAIDRRRSSSGQYDSGQFTMETNDMAEARPAPAAQGTARTSSS